MKKKLIVFLVCSISFTAVLAQQSVSIGDLQVKSNAVLYLKGNGNQGLIIPIVSSTGGFGEQGMIVFNSADNKLYYNNGTTWVEAGGASAAELDGIIGNEVTQVNTARGGLEITGSGTVASPLTMGLIQGTVDGQILKWNNTSKAWELSTVAGGASYTAGTGISITGSSIANTGDTNAADDITTATTATGDLTGTFPNPSVAKIRGVNVVATAPTSNQVLQFNGTNWAPATLPATTYTAGTGISITGSTIANTGDTNAADDITTATTATGDLTGTFPNPSVAKIRGVNVVATAPTSNQVLQFNGTNWAPATLASGTVTSAGLTMPSIFSVAGSPITTSGTFATTLATQTAATVFAAPTAATGIPTFRTLAATDIPALDAAKITTGTFPLTRITGAGATAKAVLGSDNNTLSWVASAPNQLMGTDGAGVLGFSNKSNFTFTTPNVIPKGSAAGLTASQIFDDGTNVGIGTSTPTYPLQVVGNIVNSNPSAGYLGLTGDLPGYAIGTYPTLKTSNDYLYFSAGGNYSAYLGGADVTLALNNSSAVSKVSLSTNGSSYLNGGNVGIGTASPTYPLDVNGDIRAAGFYHFIDGVYIFHISGSYSGIGDHWIPNLGNSYDLGTTGFRWRNIFLNNSPNVSSDSRLKKNISQLTYGLPEIMKLKPVSYVLKSDSDQKVKLGFIAQEVREIIPEIITEDGSGEKYLGMSYSELIPVLTNAIKEQQKTISVLKAKIEALENSESEKLNDLSAEIIKIKKILDVEAHATTK